MSEFVDAETRIIRELAETIRECKAQREQIRQLEAHWAILLNNTVEKLEAELARLKEQYSELIMSVATKYPDETRHQTALRYILAAENRRQEQKNKEGGR